MSFIKFLKGAAKVLAGVAIFLIGCLGVVSSSMIGNEIFAGISIIVALVGALYAQYQRGQQTRRMFED